MLYYLLLYQVGYYTIRVRDGHTYLIIPNAEGEQGVLNGK